MSVRQFVALVMSALAAIAQAIVTTTRLVWEGGKWVLRSLSPVPPARQAPAAAGSAADAMAALAEVIETPAPAAAALPAPEPVDPHEAWGRVAQQYAMSQSSLGDAREPDLTVLDEAAIAWLQALTMQDLFRLTHWNAKRVGQHMTGERPIESVPLCPTMREYRQSLLTAITPEMRQNLAEGRQAIQDALDDLINDPAYEPCRGI